MTSIIKNLQMRIIHVKPKPGSPTFGEYTFDDYERTKENISELRNIKRLMKRLSDTDYLLTLDYNANLKQIKSNGFKVECVKKYSTFHKAGQNSPIKVLLREYAVIKLKDEDELNFFKLIHADYIKQYAKVCDL